jgi:hypothetical protein
MTDCPIDSARTRNGNRPTPRAAIIDAVFALSALALVAAFIIDPIAAPAIYDRCHSLLQKPCCEFQEFLSFC